MIDPDFAWAAFERRDRSQDGLFVGAVKTTGIYCKPSCPARRPKRDNVVFFADGAAARAAGFRACLRCTPDEVGRDRDAVRRAAALMEAADEPLRLDDLAAAVGYAPHHFQRLFTRDMGVSPATYARAIRARRAEIHLTKEKSVTEAIYDAGFNSGSRFYETSNQLLGMTPTHYRAGGADTEMRFAVGECSLGSILVAQSAKGVCAILLGDDPDALVRDLEDRFPRATLVGGDAAFEQTVSRVIGFVEAPALGLDLPLDVRGTAFQQRVWQALCEIPAGSTASYADIAARIGAPRGARAVAQACGANALAVAIPCHRVVKTDGSVSGYRWGVERKRSLLEREHVV